MARTAFTRLATIASLALVLAACGGGGGGTTDPGGGGNVTPPGSGGGGPTGGTTGGSGGTTGGGGSTTNVITVGTTSFTPPNVTVPVNTTVTWQWSSCENDPYYGNTCAEHSVQFDDAAMGASNVQSSGAFAKTFDKAGTYKYHCSVHGAAMSGTVTVQ